MRGPVGRAFAIPQNAPYPDHTLIRAVAARHSRTALSTPLSMHLSSGAKIRLAAQRRQLLDRRRIQTTSDQMGLPRVLEMLTKQAKHDGKATPKADSICPGQCQDWPGQSLHTSAAAPPKRASTSIRVDRKRADENVLVVEIDPLHKRGAADALSRLQSSIHRPTQQHLAPCQSSPRAPRRSVRISWNILNEVAEPGRWAPWTASTWSYLPPSTTSPLACR